MDTVRTLSISAYGIQNAAKSRAPRVEKCPDYGGLHGEYHGNPQARDRRASTSDRRVLSRAGTQETAPLWYGPRLRAPFVAQFIGPILLNAEAAPVSSAAYGLNRATVALVVDRLA
jgi:hypothetical protein